jgi:drug/metabolite transporter (DMT)-like permease
MMIFDLGILFALGSAAVWGTANFAGGIASRRIDNFHVVALSAISGIAMLAGCSVLWREPFMPAGAFVWSALAGVSGGLGIAGLYRGLSIGNAALVAPTASVVGAIVPVAVSIGLEGWPAQTQLAGFACAFAGIWLVAKSAPATAESWRGFRIALPAGVGIGGFLALVAQVPPNFIFGPLIVSRLVSMSLAITIVLSRSGGLPSALANPIALGTGVLDAGGTVLYVLARQHARLDVAAVLASLYPVSTVVLAAVVMKERVSFAQAIGIVLCLTAVALIAG